MLQGKKILIGITGSIAAYKTILLVRLFIKAKAEVKVVITPAAQAFVSPLVLAVLSKNKVVTTLAENDEWENHVMLGRWADVMIIAPLSCNTLAKMAIGICDNMLLATYLSATCPIVIAPAMDEDMWKHATTQRNLQSLKKDGVHIITVNKGELASGLIGEGRMAEPDTIYFYVVENFLRATTFHKKNILITAGGTHEALDPVRFLGNYSTGKMGFAIAEEMYLQGANVTIIAGQVQVATPYKGIKIIFAKTAKEMFDAAVKEFKHTDIAIMAAAVADYKPKQTAKEKIKKKENELTLQLIKNKDILAYLGSIKKKHQLLIGFALETQQEKLNAFNKLKSKNADAIVLNSLKQKGAGFGLNTNKITILNKDGNTKDYSLKSKDAVAKDIVSFIRNIV